MHRFKGPEFKYAFIARAKQGVLPLMRAVDTSNAALREETRAAERRLLCTTLTHAQVRAFVRGCGKVSECFAGAECA